MFYFNQKSTFCIILPLRSSNRLSFEDLRLVLKGHVLPESENPDFKNPESENPDFKSDWKF